MQRCSAAFGGYFPWLVFGALDAFECFVFVEELFDGFEILSNLFASLPRASDRFVFLPEQETLFVEPWSTIVWLWW